MRKKKKREKEANIQYKLEIVRKNKREIQKKKKKIMKEEEEENRKK